MSKFNDIYLKGKDIIDIIYPIGCVYISFNAVNPSTLYIGTEWEQIKGKFLLAVDDEDADISVSAVEGGEKEHLLIESEIPSHAHNRTGHNATYGNEGQGGIYPVKFAEDKKPNWPGSINLESKVGGDKAHNNMPPYVTVYMWRRVS